MMNRREALGRLGVIFGAGILGARAGAATTSTATSDLLTSTPSASSSSAKPFTFAHITDVHIVDKNGSEKWTANALNHLQSHPKKPSLILNTGDSVMDVLKADRSRADQLWKIWSDTLQRENSLPIYHCLGNHDIFGYGLPAEHAAKSDPDYGKKLAMDNLGLDKIYYSFDHSGWHFVALDTVQPFDGHPSGWIGKLDDEQFAWLEKDLAETPADRPVVEIGRAHV